MHLPSFLLSPLINAALPAIVTAVAAVAYQYVKKGVTAIDNLSPKIHEYVFGAFAIIQPVIAPFLAQALPGVTDIHAVSLPVVQSLVGLLAGKLVHQILKK